ncbi:hypothetical protein IFM89_034817 [Coptis chinensis]|uniref:Uncharacterized protein n=1 Tax=Coptis chinensis TaxID=261450 RepID=A0A835LKE1_9MAGN|nr:hypothetical protein IFM89_034817 [Coptis chinensis]
MDPKNTFILEDELCNTGPDDETLIREKKRSRRVSFAENTSVHVFDRDDESSDNNTSTTKSPIQLQLLLPQSNNNEDDDVSDEEQGPHPFFIENYSSPGSSSALGSATSNDEENFFGPVSASFIRLGRRQSDLSVASDDYDNNNCEMTLDSTAFSMHFQSLVRSDFGSNVKTPTSVELGPSGGESFMEMSGVKKVVMVGSGGDSSGGGGCDSSDMSLIKTYSSKYDYAKLSPGLDALLAKSNNDIECAFVDDKVSNSKSGGKLDCENGYRDFMERGVVENVEINGFKAKELNDFEKRDTPMRVVKTVEINEFKDRELNGIEKGDTCNDMESDGNGKLFEAYTGLETTPIREKIKDCFVGEVDTELANASTSHQNQSGNTSIQKLVESLVPDTINKVTHALSDSGLMLPFIREHPLLKTNNECLDGYELGDRRQGRPILEGTPQVQDVDNSGRKRRIEIIETMDNNNSSENGKGYKRQRVSLEMEGSVSESHMELCLAGNNEVEKSGRHEEQGHWSNVSRELFGTIEGLLLPSVGKLDTQELDILEDLLGRMQKAAKYGKFSALLHFQKNVQLLQSGIQESQKLKLSLKNIVLNNPKDALKKDVPLPFLSANLSSTNADAYNKVITKQHEVGALDEKVKNLMNSVFAGCKIKGGQNPDECIILVDDYLRKRTRCRLTQKEFQREDGHYNLGLNYCDLLVQSFTISRTSKLVALNMLNNVKIMKSFPNVNAYTALGFVFNDEAARSFVNSKSLAVETQMTRFFLHNLMVVVEEVQQSCIEIRNLAQSCFRPPCVGQLELELRFVDFKTGSKVILTLDVTSLNRGVYPLQVRPRISVNPTQESLSTDIEAAIRTLKAGYWMILRLCKCVSEVLNASSK